MRRGRVVGIVTRSDLLAALSPGAAPARKRRPSPEPAHPPWLVSPNRDKFP